MQTNMYKYTSLLRFNIQQVKLQREMSSQTERCLHIHNINPNLVAMKYDVRDTDIRAGEIEKEITAGEKKPFAEVIRGSIGDCHAMGQKPLTYLRQMLALGYYNELFKSTAIPEDVKERAKIVLQSCQGQSLGSYSDSCGLEIVRRQVADFITARDGVDSNWQNIFLTAGASPAIKIVLSLLSCQIDGKTAGALIPIPQYPLYSATLAEYGMTQIGYYLNEETNWSLDINELQRTLDGARDNSAPRALVVINPGNPTGQVLTRENIEAIIRFATKEKLVILADEVYQHNVYDRNSKFHSFKKVMMEMGAPYNGLELASFMSTSKGYLGERGIRGGYMELTNFSIEVKAVLTTPINTQCPTTAGQMAVSALVNPPRKGDDSYELYVKERDTILKALVERAALVYKTINSLEGFSCNVVQGAMYAFLRINFPSKAIKAAKEKNMPADTFYCFELLESTGVCIIPGSGFKQKPGTHHFRTTILPQVDKLENMLEKLEKFHASFMEKYK